MIQRLHLPLLAIAALLVSPNSVRAADIDWQVAPYVWAADTGLLDNPAFSRSMSATVT
jgi:hypothetical protein